MTSVDPVPDGGPTLVPRLVVRGAAQAIEFYEQAFAASEVGYRFTMPDGTVVHSDVRIGDSVVHVTDESGDGHGVAPSASDSAVSAIMSLTVDDVDAWWQRAVDAGCTVVYPLADQFYGDRSGRLRDPFGQQWMLRTAIEDLDPDEVERRMAQWAAEQQT